MAIMDGQGALLPHQSGRDDPPPSVLVEVLALRYEDECWRYRRSAGPLAPRTDPDAAARAVVRLDPMATTILHSTSWRYESSGTLILTYALLPDPDPSVAGAEPLRSLELARGTHPAGPAPAHVSVRHVAAHALRHLALLARTDPVVASALGEHPELISALAGLTAGPAGQLITSRS